MSIRMGAWQRLSGQPDTDECLEAIGVAIDYETALQITQFCWVNGLDDSNIVFQLADTALMVTRIDDED